MYDITPWLAASATASPLTEILMQSVGMLVVALVGALILASFLRRLLFKSVAEGGAGLDRRFHTAPRPSDALECRTTSKLLRTYRR